MQLVSACSCFFFSTVAVYCTCTLLQLPTNRTDSELLAIKPTDLNSY